MLKIRVEDGVGAVELKGNATNIMADMCIAVHAFYNAIPEEHREHFVETFHEAEDIIFTDDDDLHDVAIKKAAEMFYGTEFGELIDELKKLREAMDKTNEH